MKINASVTISGPMFSRGGRIVHAAAQGVISDLVEEGTERLDQMLRPRPAGVYLSVQEARKGKASTGHYRRNLHPMVKDLYGRIDDGNVVYGPWLEGTGSRNATPRFKGYASFRRTAQFMQKQVPAIMQRRIAQAVQELGG